MERARCMFLWFFRFNKYLNFRYYKNGDYYNGEWEEDRKEGMGTMFYSDTQEVYEGEWMGDVRAGMGKLMLPNGQIIESSWRNNQAQGEGKLINS